MRKAAFAVLSIVMFCLPACRAEEAPRHAEAHAELKPNGIWLAPFYYKNSIDGFRSSAGTWDSDTKLYGVTLGYSRLTPVGLLGAVLNLGRYDAEGKGKLTGSSAEGDVAGFGTFFGTRLGAWNVAASLSHHWLDGNLRGSVHGVPFRSDAVKARIFTAGLKGSFLGLRRTGNLKVTPFLGVNYAHYGEDAFTVSIAARPLVDTSSGSFSQWTFPLGLHLDWDAAHTPTGWSFRPSLELAYVRAAGDVNFRTKLRRISGGAGAVNFNTAMADENSFHASFNLEAQRKWFSLGVKLSGTLSSHQRSFGAALTGKWQF